MQIAGMIFQTGSSSLSA
ncbi:MAG: hypothetical protein ACLUTU_12935 [Blautia faecis]